MKKLGLGVVGVMAAFLSSVALAGGWIELGIGFLTYKDAGPSEVLNLAHNGEQLFAASSEDGLHVVTVSTGEKQRIAPPEGLESVDDIALVDGFLFALDAREPGAVAVLRNDESWVLAGPAKAVDVGPFSGVSAAAGVMVVSGGTKPMSWYGYDDAGVLSDVRSRPDFGRGQPDVLMAPDGEHALISAHIGGPDFGVIWSKVNDAGLAVEPLDYIALPDAGFTSGGQHPASFPIQAAFEANVAFVAHGGGVAVVELDQQVASLATVLDVGYPLTAITVSGSRVLVAGRQSGVATVTRLRWQSSELSVEAHQSLDDVVGEVSDLALHNDRLYLAAGASGLLEVALP